MTRQVCDDGRRKCFFEYCSSPVSCRLLCLVQDTRSSNVGNPSQVRLIGHAVANDDRMPMGQYAKM